MSFIRLKEEHKNVMILENLFFRIPT